MKRLPFVVLGIMVLSSQSIEAQELSTEDPLADITADMAVVMRDLSRLSTGKPTQKTQQIVVKKLDELIVRLEKECAACRGGGASGANPTRPLADSVVVGGPGGIGDLHAPRDGDKKWGELPARQRDRILQSLTEGFPAHYQQILQRYYRRLAEEKPASKLEDGPPRQVDQKGPRQVDQKDQPRTAPAGVSKNEAGSKQAAPVKVKSGKT